MIGSTVTAMLVVVACQATGRSRPAPPYAGSNTATAPTTLAAVLHGAGYVAVPVRMEGGVPFARATIATVSANLRLDSGAPFDLLLDSSLVFGRQLGVHMTNVLSGYWTFTSVQGRWAVVDRVTLGTTALEELEAKVEPRTDSMSRGALGATALMSRGAIMDYATDSLYLPSPRGRSTSSTAEPSPGARSPTLRAALERAGRYGTFLALVRRVGLMSLLEEPTGAAAPDSVAWLGLRIRAAQLSGVGAMPPNDMHVRLTRQAVDEEIGGSRRRTLFVPTDAAFARLPAETLAALRDDPARLARLLRTHVYAGAAIDTNAMRTLIRGAAHPGSANVAFGFHVLGQRIDVDRLTSWEEGRVVARAAIVDPDMRAAHGGVIAHGIDRVLMTSSSSSSAAVELAAVLARQGYVAVPLYRREDGNGYLVRATVNGAPARLTIATGSPGDIVLDRQWVARLQPSSGADRVVTFDLVRLGPVRVETADFSGPLQSVRRQGYRAVDGVVGSALLVRYQARLDWGAGVLYLRIPPVLPVHTAHVSAHRAGAAGSRVARAGALGRSGATSS